MDVNSDDTFYPLVQSSESENTGVIQHKAAGGITIRAFIATQILNGMLSRDLNSHDNAQTLSAKAVKYADALIAELNKKGDTE